MHLSYPNYIWKTFFFVPWKTNIKCLCILKYLSGWFFKRMYVLMLKSSDMFLSSYLFMPTWCLPIYAYGQIVEEFHLYGRTYHISANDVWSDYMYIHECGLGFSSATYMHSHDSLYSTYINKNNFYLRRDKPTSSFVYSQIHRQ